MATSSSITGARTDVVLDWVSYVHYQVRFQKNFDEIQVFINSGSEVNAIAPAYAKKLGLQKRKTDIRAQKIDGLALETYEMVIAGFQVNEKPLKPSKKLEKKTDLIFQ